ncbi:hypothetical protein [Candidatus Nitrosocosmicus sp. R]
MIEKTKLITTVENVCPKRAQKHIERLSAQIIVSENMCSTGIATVKIRVQITRK